LQEVVITDEMLIEARRKSVEMGQLHNSITRGAGNLAGFIGEEIAAHVLGAMAENTYDYDLVLPDGSKVDVKTKRTSVMPKEHYECSVAALNTKQDCDYYAFVRVLNDLSVGWFLGVYPKEKYYQDANLLEKGDKDPSNGYVVKTSCYNLPISSLHASVNI
jgi:hypothetical protein